MAGAGRTLVTVGSTAGRDLVVAAITAPVVAVIRLPQALVDGLRGLARLETIDGHLAELLARLEDLESRVQALDNSLDRVDERLGKVNRRLKKVDGRLRG